MGVAASGSRFQEFKISGIKKMKLLWLLTTVGLILITPYVSACVKSVSCTAAAGAGAGCSCKHCKWRWCTSASASWRPGYGIRCAKGLHCGREKPYLSLSCQWNDKEKNVKRMSRRVQQRSIDPMLSALAEKKRDHIVQKKTTEN